MLGNPKACFAGVLFECPETTSLSYELKYNNYLTPKSKLQRGISLLSSCKTDRLITSLELFPPFNDLVEDGVDKPNDSEGPPNNGTHRGDKVIPPTPFARYEDLPEYCFM